MSEAKPRKRRRFRYVVPTVLSFADGPPLVMKTVWAPIALRPVMIWDLDGNTRLLSYEIRLAPTPGAPRGFGQSLGLWLSYQLRRLAGWRHYPALDDVARFAGVPPYRVRDACRAIRDYLPPSFARGLYFSTLDTLFATCEQLPHGHYTREVPVQNFADPIELHRHVIRLIEEPRFRQQHQYLLPNEAADLLRCSKQWLAKARETGEGPLFIRRGRNILYRRGAVEDWALAHETRSTKAA